MNLDFLKEVTNHRQKNEKAQDFINELEIFLKQKQKYQNFNKSILEEVEKLNSTSLISKNKIRNQKNEILQGYAKKTNTTLYFITNKLENNIYRIEKYDGNRKENIQMSSQELPKEARLNDVMHLENGKLVVDKQSTQDVIKDIKNRASQILEEQNKKLAEYKKEGHSYKVTENRNHRVYLWDITIPQKIEIEAVDFPEELKDKAVEGTIIEYQNGKYVIKE